MVKIYPRIMCLKFMKQRKGVCNGTEKVLVSPTFFGFGLSLMKNIREMVCQDKIKKEGTTFVQNALENVMRNENIWEAFCRAIPSQMFEDFEERDIDLNDVYEFVIEKALKARTGVEINQFEEDNTRRNAKKASDLALRTFLKAGTKRNIDKKEQSNKKQKTKGN